MNRLIFAAAAVILLFSSGCAYNVGTNKQSGNEISPPVTQSDGGYVEPYPADAGPPHPPGCVAGVEFDDAGRIAAFICMKPLPVMKFFPLPDPKKGM